jgi:hypothetical protein
MRFRRISTLFHLLLEVHLDLSMNFFGGKIPEALYDLSILRKLDVSVNQITGLLASGLGKLGVLTVFNVRSNLITGTNESHPACFAPTPMLTS